jgi:hypothetical protein
LSLDSVSPFGVKIDSSLYQGLPGTYTITLTATAGLDTTITNSAFHFDVVLSCQLTFSTTTIADFSFSFNALASSYELTLPAYTLSPTFCQPSLDSLFITDSANNPLNFMTQNLAANKIIISPGPSDVGTHAVVIKATVSMPDVNLTRKSFTQTFLAWSFNLSLLCQPE